MQAVEFQTTWKKIVSAMPKEKRSELGGHDENEMVRVIVLASPQPQSGSRKDLIREAQEKGYTDFLEYLIDYPLDVPHPTRFTREELHER